jgi:DedD protein
MGLFSFLSKNKQDRRTADVSGHFSRAEDDALGERARSKRASNAGERRGKGPDPVLPEKKRARRRLVGAIALALAAAVGLPMLLDAEPKPLAGDIAIQIPSKDKAAPLPVPSDPVSAADSVDQGEEIVEAPKPKQAAVAAPAIAPPVVAEVRAAPPKHEPARAEPAKAAHPKAEPPKPEPKPEHKALAKAEPKPEPKPPVPVAAAAKPVDKPAPKAGKPDEKPRAQSPEDASRALAILEGNQAEKAHEAAGGKFVLQVAALGSQEKAAELQAKLREAGIHSFTQKLSKPSGELIRVKVGPFSKEEAEKVRARLGKLGLSGTMVPA